MADQREANGKVEKPAEALPLGKRMVAWLQQGWRPAGTAVAIGLALMLGWHVVNGKHGLSVWHQMRAQDRELQEEINDLQQENAGIHKQIDELKSNPDAIVRKAHEGIHYVKPDEVIYMLPEPPVQQPGNAGK